jgi:hypothetical protein
VNAHLIYTFHAMKMRPHYPLESDYVATCSVDTKTYLKIDRLELQGVFEQEYDKLSKRQKLMNFKQVVT